MKIYLAGSVSAGREFAEGIIAICNELEKKGHVILTKNLVVNLNPKDGQAKTIKDREFIVNRDMKLLAKSDFVVMEVSQNSHGVGYEHRRAEELGKPILLLRHKSLEGQRYSAFLVGQNYARQMFAFYDEKNVAEIICGFLEKFQVTQGKFLVIEGSDGSGKRTQRDLLAKRIAKETKREAIKLDFPQYDLFFGKLVGKYLAEDFGNPSPYLASLTFALDRWSAKSKIKKALESGRIVLANRYYLSNMAHQTARMPSAKRRDFMKFLETLELKEFGIPKDHATIYLHVPPKTQQKLVDRKEERGYIKGRKRDLHEADIKHLTEASRMYERLAEKYPRIKRIECTDAKGNLKTIDEIHNLVWNAVSKLL